jgi:hypothetical protein
MTKIAIVPNAAGTGTFTIEAPNSNSNRTLVLPDAAGEIYGQGNILGTVSQSAGVPTGAIIERGSNANGEFVKYADGTMICTRNDFVMVHVASDRMTSQWTYPALFLSGTRPTTALTLPTFNSANFLNISGANQGRSSVRHWGTAGPGSGGSNAETQASVFFDSGTVATNSEITACHVSAIGRWF